MNIPLIVTASIVSSFLLAFAYVRLIQKPKKLNDIRDKIKAGETRSSIRKLKSIIHRQGGTVDIHFLIAECYRLEKRYRMAVPEYRHCLAVGKRSYIATEKDIREGLLKCLVKLNKEDETIEELISLAKISTNNSDYLFQIAKIFFVRGDLEHAATYFDRTLKAKSDHVESLTYLGLIMFHAGQTKEAAAYLTKAVQINPKNYRAFYFLGRLYKAGRAFTKAIICFESATASPKFRARASFQKGICYSDLNETDRAIREYKNGLYYSAGTENKELVLASKHALAGLYEKKGLFSEAIEQWEDISSTNANYRDVAQKLEVYHTIRTDDNIKDFMVDSKQAFEETCLQITDYLGYELLEITHLSSSIINILSLPKQMLLINLRRQRVLIKIYREAVTLGANVVKNLVEESINMSCSKAICISPLNFKPDALEIAAEREIDLIGGDRLIKILAAIKG
jgi:tetratricopeptide (TPR) repeat protein